MGLKKKKFYLGSVHVRCCKKCVEFVALCDVDKQSALQMPPDNKYSYKARL